MKKKIVSLVLNNCKNDSRVIKTADSLAKKGFKLEIIALKENELPELEKTNFSQIIRVDTFFWKNFRKSIIAFFVIFPLYLEIFIKISKKIFSEKKNIFAIHCNDLKTLPIGLFAKLTSFGKIKIVYDCHEYETEIASSKTIRFFNKILERILIYYAEEIITVSDSIANEYSKLYKIKKPDVILNCPYFYKNTETNIFRKKFNLQSYQTIFLYQGGLTSGRGIELILQVFESLSNDKVIVFMGNGKLSEKIIESSQNYENIFYLDAVESNVLLNYTSSADIGLLLYENISLNHYFCSPNKFFEYTQAGLPIIVSDLYEMEKIVTKYKNGIVVNNNYNSFKTAVENINKNKIQIMKKNIEKMKLVYNWENQEKILTDIYNNL